MAFRLCLWGAFEPTNMTGGYWRILEQVQMDRPMDMCLNHFESAKVTLFLIDLSRWNDLLRWSLGVIIAKTWIVKDLAWLGSRGFESINSKRFKFRRVCLATSSPSQPRFFRFSECSVASLSQQSSFRLAAALEKGYQVCSEYLYQSSSHLSEVLDAIASWN